MIARSFSPTQAGSYNRAMIEPERIKPLNDDAAVSGKYVLYWMQASQRSRNNAALEFAVARANELSQPVLVGFGLMDDYPEANARHYAFMLSGLKDVAQALRERGIGFAIRRGQPPRVALDLARDASLVVCDRGYLRHQRLWRQEVAREAGKSVVQVEADAVVPIDAASTRLEFAARTIRPKITRLLSRFLQPMKSARLGRKWKGAAPGGDIDVADPAKALAALKVDASVGPSPLLAGGQEQAAARLKSFLAERLSGYASGRREPSVRGTSLLAAYLHFGQISPLEIALAVKASSAPAADREAFLEELIIRRELAFNFCERCERYDSFDGLPAWARQTLAEHEADARPYAYTRRQLEEAKTDDLFWNAAQREMLVTGYMHNMMRMYWGKKILEWKQSPREAFDDAVYLNNKYFLCGRDPASYANVGWLFGLHDRPWARRKIFGTVRYMNAGGLKRKFDMEAYLKMVESL